MEHDDARQLLEAERHRLQSVRTTLENGHLHDQSEDESTSTLSHLHQHPADLGSDTFEREKDFSILEQVEAELVDVERAMHRLDEGTYGSCQACGGRIDDERLEAIPAARFCMSHQAEAEVF